MSDQTWWYLSRSSGIVALVLLVLSLVWGVLLATRVLGPRVSRAWLLELHRWFGSLAIVTTALHLGGLVLDSYVSFGWTEILVPGASDYQPVGVALGVFGMYGLVAVQATSLARRRLPTSMWRRVHLVSYATLWAAAMHAGMTGTDVSHRAYQALALLLTLTAVAAVLVRMLVPGRGQAASR